MIENKVRAAITAVEAYLPDYVLTNDELSRMVDTSDEWIMTRVGIKERRILKKEDAGMTYMAVKAVKTLLEKNNIDPSEIGALICSTVTPDMVFPSSAAIIANACGIVDAMTFDMNVGCAGFIHACKTASLYIESARSRHRPPAGGRPLLHRGHPWRAVHPHRRGPADPLC